MKRTILLLWIFLIIPSLCFGADAAKVMGTLSDPAGTNNVGKINGITWGTTAGNATKVNGVACAAAGASYVFQETFEGSNACYGGIGNYCDNAWTWIAASMGVRSSTGPLQGTYSSASTDDTTANMNKSIAAADEYYLAVMISITDYTRNEAFDIILANASETARCTATNWQQNVYGINSGGTNTSDVITTLANSTTYYMKIRAKKGTGANAECQVYVSSNGTSWTATQTSTNGTWTDQIGKFVLTKNQTGIKFDDIRVSTGDISY